MAKRAKCDGGTLVEAIHVGRLILMQLGVREFISYAEIWRYINHLARQ
jgi:hypothetical protein